MGSNRLLRQLLAGIAAGGALAGCAQDADDDGAGGAGGDTVGMEAGVAGSGTGGVSGTGGGGPGGAAAGGAGPGGAGPGGMATGGGGGAGPGGAGPGGAGPGGAGPGGAGAGGMGAGGTDTSSLDPAPAGAECYGEATMETGPCCPEVACMDVDAEKCPFPKDETQWDLAYELGYTNLGSGECLCKVDGPYANTAAVESEGDCCYVVYIQGCEGRPFMLADIARTAEPVRRSDWS